MAGSDDEMTAMQPLIGYGSLGEAADTMLAASRTMLAAASAISSGVGGGDARARELTAEAIESGFLRALRRESLLAGTGTTAAPTAAVGLPAGGGAAGTGYGRMGASITGQGARSQLYGSIGGAIGYAVGGPVGALLGGMLGGLIGDQGEGEAAQARQEAELRRQWLNTPEGFEIQAYLYSLSQGLYGGSALAWLMAQRQEAPAGSAGRFAPVIVNFPPGAVQIVGQDAEAGARAARAFAGELGRVLRLNSVVVPAAGEI